MSERTVRVLSVTLRDFRGYEEVTAEISAGLTVVSGPNGAGKTNLLEGLYFGCTGLSFRTSNDRDLVRFGSKTTRAVVRTGDLDGEHELAVGFSPGEPKRMSVDGTQVGRLLDVPGRPLISVFAPDRLELVKGVPALRRAHMDQFVTALWPARAATRRAYSETLAQRNSLLARVRAGHAAPTALGAWNIQLADLAIRLMEDRGAAIELITPHFQSIARALGLPGDCAVSYRPRSRAVSPSEFADELEHRLESDLDRGFTTHGPHRDDLTLAQDGRDLRAFGSQGQQRLGLLALLLSERRALGQLRPAPPVMVLDDVMSELDGERREALAELLRAAGGQSIITTTDLEHVPGARTSETGRVAVRAGRLIGEAVAA